MWGGQKVGSWTKARNAIGFQDQVAPSKYIGDVDDDDDDDDDHHPLKITKRRVARFEIADRMCNMKHYNISTCHG